MKNRTVKLKIFAILIFSFLIFVFGFSLIQAAEFKFDPNYPWKDIKTLGGKEGLVSKFYIYALAAAGVAAFGAIIYGGILWTMSSAVSSQAEAKEWITAAVSGLALLLFAVLLFKLINPVILELREPSESMSSSTSSSSK
ncbi:hypothetical protein HZB06_00800 [Candidatus Wolfebacteria bacterium]|nr:hypothetical protein [Candidatus Wolfebacteria bacterium]